MRQVVYVIELWSNSRGDLGPYGWSGTLYEIHATKESAVAEAVRLNTTADSQYPWLDPLPADLDEAAKVARDRDDSYFSVAEVEVK